jgi:hypothetical protein
MADARPRRQARELPYWRRTRLIVLDTRELDARVALALVKRDYRQNPAHYTPSPYNGILKLAVTLRRAANECCYWFELTSLARYVCLGYSSDEWAEAWAHLKAAPLRRAAKLAVRRRPA